MHTNPMSIPGITKTCRAKNRDSVAPAMIGPPSINLTIAGPAIGTRLAIEAPIPSPPIGVLIKAQHLPAERHAESHQQKKNADDPGELSGKLVGPKKEDLHHMNENNRHHEVRAPPVQRADEPAKSHVVVESLKAAPRLASRRNVNQGKQNPCDDLENEHHECGAAEYVPPTCRVARNGMLGNLADRSRKMQAPIDPVPDLGNQAHDGFFPAREALTPGVGSSPA